MSKLSIDSDDSSHCVPQWDLFPKHIKVAEQFSNVLCRTNSTQAYAQINVAFEWNATLEHTMLPQAKKKRKSPWKGIVTAVALKYLSRVLCHVFYDPGGQMADHMADAGLVYHIVWTWRKYLNFRF